VQQNAPVDGALTSLSWSATFGDRVIASYLGACIRTNNANGESPKTPVRLRMRTGSTGLELNRLLLTRQFGNINHDFFHP